MNQLNTYDEKNRVRNNQVKTVMSHYKVENLHQFYNKQRNDNINKINQIFQETTDQERDMRKTNQQALQFKSKLKKNQNLHLNEHKEEIARFKAIRVNETRNNAMVEQELLSTEPDILHVNQERFRAQISGRVNKNDKITEYYQKDSPLKTLTIASKEKGGNMD